MKQPGTKLSERDALVAGVVVIVVMVACCGGGIALIHAFGGGGPGTQAAATSTPIVTAINTATTAPAPIATATVDPQVSVYTMLVSTDLATLVPAMQQTGTDCQNEDLPACRADLQHVQNLTVSFLVDLDNTPLPPCLQAADGKLREALIDIENGAQMGGSGIDDNNPQEINDGAALVTQGGQEMGQARADVEAAVCP